MYGIIDYESRYVVGELHHHKNFEDLLVVDRNSICYTISKFSFWINKTNFYTGLSAYMSNVQIISELQYQTIVLECEKMIKCKSLLTNSLDALMKTKTAKTKINEEITD